MVRTEVYCDRCRVLIPADRTKLVVECGPLRTHRSDRGGASIDLCRECAGGLSAWLRAEVEAGAVRTGPAD